MHCTGSLLDMNVLSSSPTAPRGVGFSKLQRAQATYAAPEKAVDTFQRRDPVRVYILDVFAQPGQRPSHGDLVEAELTRRHETEGPNATVNVVHKRVDSWEGFSGIAEGKPGALEARLRNHFKVRLERDADAFAEIVEGGGPRSVIQQSQGASQSRVLESLYNTSKHEPEFRAALQRQLGIEPTEGYGEVEKRQLLQGLVNESDRVHKNDPEVRNAIDELRLIQDEAFEQGHVHVISAGNQGALSREMQDLGVKAPEGFFTNEMAGPHSIVIGATDDGTDQARSSNPHRVADLASPGAGAIVGADGVDRPFSFGDESRKESGSSYAAPQGSSVIVDMLREDMDIPQDAIVRNLRSQASPISGGENFVGSGALKF